MFLTILCDKKLVQFLYTGSSFLLIMITYTVEFCKNERSFMLLTIFHADDENDNKTLFI